MKGKVHVQNNKIAEMRLFFLPFFGNCVMFKEMEGEICRYTQPMM